MTEEQLSALLRIKRHEQPPAGYYDQLLRDVHRRQRAELLRRPLWRIAMDRAQTFFGEHSISHASYAGALASVLILGVAAISVFSPVGGKQGDGGPRFVDNAPAAAKTLPVISLEQGPTPHQPIFDRQLTFQTGQTAYKAPATQQPRYIIDARPVSYEPSFSF
jgi:hypothetical protein